MKGQKKGPLTCWYQSFITPQLGEKFLVHSSSLVLSSADCYYEGNKARGSEARKRVQNGVAISLEGNLTKMQWNEMGPHLRRQLRTPVTGTCCKYCKERLIQRGRNKFRGFSTQLFCASTHISILSVSWELPTPNNRLVSPPPTKKHHEILLLSSLVKQNIAHLLSNTCRFLHPWVCGLFEFFTYIAANKAVFIHQSD